MIRLTHATAVVAGAILCGCAASKQADKKPGEAKSDEAMHMPADSMSGKLPPSLTMTAAQIEHGGVSGARPPPVSSRKSRRFPERSFPMKTGQRDSARRRVAEF